jgi:HTH-type transcriptional regulator, sugar sensing transcriptional regulator
MMQDFLSEVGLSKNEARIYQMLLESGPSMVGDISSKTKIHRRNVYDSIERLKEKGFASWTIRNNRKFFEAVDPKRIIDIFDERKEKVKSIIPLISRRGLDDRSVVKLYTGREGRKIIFNDKLNSKGEQLVLGAHEPSKTSSKYKLYHQKRIAKGIHLKFLYPASEIKAAEYFSKLKYVQARILPKPLSESPVTVNIYENKVAFLMEDKKKQPSISILIEDKNLSEDFRKYFYAIWNVSKKL